MLGCVLGCAGVCAEACWDVLCWGVLCWGVCWDVLGCVMLGCVHGCVLGCAVLGCEERIVNWLLSSLSGVMFGASLCLCLSVNQKFIQKQLRPLVDKDTEAYLELLHRLYLR